jgi:hypothetical protein
MSGPSCCTIAVLTELAFAVFALESKVADFVFSFDEVFSSDEADLALSSSPLICLPQDYGLLVYVMN